MLSGSKSIQFLDLDNVALNKKKLSPLDKQYELMVTKKV